jgi:mycofactocin precursor
MSSTREHAGALHEPDAAYEREQDSPPQKDPEDLVVEDLVVEDLVVEDLLVEDVSIDGMCGVY